MPSLFLLLATDMVQEKDREVWSGISESGFTPLSSCHEPQRKREPEGRSVVLSSYQSYIFYKML